MGKHTHPSTTSCLTFFSSSVGIILQQNSSIFMWRGEYLAGAEAPSFVGGYPPEDKDDSLALPDGKGWDSVSDEGPCGTLLPRLAWVEKEVNLWCPSSQDDQEQDSALEAMLSCSMCRCAQDGRNAEAPTDEILNSLLFRVLDVIELTDMPPILSGLEMCPNERWESFQMDDRKLCI